MNFKEFIEVNETVYGVRPQISVMKYGTLAVNGVTLNNYNNVFLFSIDKSIFCYYDGTYLQPIKYGNFLCLRDTIHVVAQLLNVTNSAVITSYPIVALTFNGHISDGGNSYLSFDDVEINQVSKVNEFQGQQDMTSGNFDGAFNTLNFSMNGSNNNRLGIDLVMDTKHSTFVNMTFLLQYPQTIQIW